MTKAEKEKRQDALWESFCHWTDNVAEPRGFCPDYAPDECACCLAFGRDCADCPLEEYVGGCCDDTPFNDVCIAWDKSETVFDGGVAVDDAFTNMAVSLLLMYYSEGGK